MNSRDRNRGIECGGGWPALQLTMNFLSLLHYGGRREDATLRNHTIDSFLVVVVLLCNDISSEIVTFRVNFEVSIERLTQGRSCILFIRMGRESQYFSGSSFRTDLNDFKSLSNPFLS